MQPTSAALTALITGLAVEVDAGLELLDTDDTLIYDISDALIAEGSSVSWEATGSIHRRCRLRVVEAIDFGALRLRPYMTLTDGASTQRVDLGVFIPVAVERTYTEGLGETYSVEAVDKLVLLDTPIGATYQLASGAVYVTEAQTLVETIDPGTVTVLHDGEQGSTTLPADRIWELSDSHTYLSVANGLLYAVGYRELWVDEDGAYRFSQYVAPADRSAEWTYDWTATDATVGLDRSEQADWWDAPNDWVFIRNRPAVGVASADSDGSDGRYAVTNLLDGGTGQNARGGIVRRRIVPVDAADQTALVAQADRIVADDKRVVVRRRFTCEPNPLHGHHDVVELVDDVFGSGKALVRAWTLPLDGSPMDVTAEMV